VIGTVGYPGNQNQKCAAVAYGSSAGTGTVYALGGNVNFWMSSKKWAMWRNPNSFLLPVRRGAGFSVGVIQVQGGDVTPPIAFFWVPLGSGAQLWELSEEEREAYGLAVPDAPAPIPRSRRVEQDVDGLMDAIEHAFGDRLTPARTERLRLAVLALARRPTSESPTTPQVQE